MFAHTIGTLPSSDISLLNTAALLFLNPPGKLNICLSRDAQ